MMCLFPSLGLFPSFLLCSLSIDSAEGERRHKDEEQEIHNTSKKNVGSKFVE